MIKVNTSMKVSTLNILKIESPQSWTKLDAHPSGLMEKGIFWQLMSFNSYYRASLIYQVSI